MLASRLAGETMQNKTVAEWLCAALSVILHIAIEDASTADFPS
jgi:hypothetical protein